MPNIRSQVEGFMRNRMGSVGNAWANWGLAGARESFTRGAMSGLGFYKSPAGKYRFMSGTTLKGFMGLGVGAGIGSAVYAMTDNPLLGAGAGLGAAWAAHGGGLWGTTKGVGGAGLKALPMLFMGASVLEGFREGGVGGAIKGLGVGLLEWGLVDVGLGAIGAAFKGSAATGSIKAAVGVGLPLAAVAGIGYGLYTGAQQFAERGREAVRTEFAGDMTNFTTQAAYTMRQRALQEISRSHTNSRTILGQEASLMHMR